MMSGVVQHIRLRDLSDDELMHLSERLHLSLNLEEMKRIQRYFSDLGRDPTDIELHSIAQAWSEHCCYKSSKSILRRFIFSTASGGCTEEDAGVVEFDDEHAYVVAFESHNHPSAIEPYGGAATGIGGVVRDVVCMGAQPIALIDPLFFGPLDVAHDDLPRGVKHPRYLLDGVVAGISDYGNRIGIPTCAGMVFFDDGFIGNCIVNVGCVGIMKKRDMRHSIAYPDEMLVLVGGLTGRDGIHGVTFASATLSAEEDFRSAVQLGDPIKKEPLIHAILEANSLGLISGMKDLGGGGLSCAVIEMCAAGKCSADVRLERVPLKEEGMQPWEIWISESQERFLLCAAREKIPELIEIFDCWDISASVIGETRRADGDEKIRIFYYDDLIYEIDLAFITDTPIYERKRRARTTSEREIAFPAPRSYEHVILNMLKMHNIASKEHVVRRYDFDVRASTVVKPLHGMIGAETHADATVLKPLEHSFRGIALTADVNPSYTRINPFWGAASAVDEACRNLVAVGAKPHAFADCLNFGSPENENVMNDFHECCRALNFMASSLGIPFVSGNVSFYNENEETGEPIPPTPTIMGIGICDDVRICVTVDAKVPSNPLYVVGDTKNELGGSAYFRLIGLKGGIVPRTDPIVLKRRMDAVLDAVRRGLVASCHDISDGGLAIALCEMLFGGDLGAEIDLRALGDERSDIKLFSETNSRWIIEVKRSKDDDFEHEMRRKGVFVRQIGELKRDKSMIIRDREEILNISTDTLREAWRNAF